FQGLGGVSPHQSRFGSPQLSLCDRCLDYAEDGVVAPADAESVCVWNRRFETCSDWFSGLVWPRALERAQSVACFGASVCDEPDAGVRKLWAERLCPDGMGSDGQRAGTEG